MGSCRIRRKSLISLLLCSVLGLLMVAPAAAETWYESYDLAEEALADEQWVEAIRHLNSALQENPQSSARILTYGLRYIPYFPYLKLGIAHYHLGELEAAERAFETEERQGQIERSAKGRAEMAHYRDLIRQARAAEETEQQRRRQQVVAESMATALALEEQGKLDAALAALAKVLAVAPDHPEARAARQRLLSAAAEQQRRREAEERHAHLLEQGRNELASGRYQEAAASLRRALELQPESDTQALLDRAQQGLRAEIEEHRDGEQRRRLLADSLARAVAHEASGELVPALHELQSVLALDPRNPDALTMQQRLLTAQAADEESQSRRQTIGQLLAEAERLLRAGDYVPALTSANRVLALQGDNEAALRCLSEAYRKLGERLLETDSAPPTILVDDQRQERPDGSRVELLHSPRLVLTGSVYDSTEVELSFLANGQELSRATLTPRELLGVWITDFRLETRLPAGRTEIQVVALDRTGETATESYTVEYVVPFTRSLWFPAAIAGVLVAAAAVVVGLRARRRRQLLQRRFNPYIAGAPVLEQERFFGRQGLLEYVLRRISNNSILLYGERRIGKTSFQHRLKQCLSELEDPVYRFYPVFIDLQGIPEERFFSTIALEVFDELAPQLDGRVPAPPARGEVYGYRELVKDIRLVLKALQDGTDNKVKLVLLIDEVDELNDYDPRVNQKLRSLFMRTFADSLVSVVSGVAITKQWQREGSPWYNFFQEIEVQPLDREEAVALIEAPVRGIFRFEDGVVEELLRRTGCRPYQIQCLCSRLVDRLHEEQRRVMTRTDLESACRAEGL